ncbi:Na+/H+ antiporter subunit E [Paracoccus caeni]|uniref:Na+/H+ antiporter subunit E n=1 Tax=Paracoccus caeni TaxID=657651 RepID=A0A934SET2_9RHOB|nr:Na+/H+ antiporter subunit E [Paracoccus caeni]MBK4216040.1 Na+/H+ antiporter subunit E [Paracoccus caeni]
MSRLIPHPMLSVALVLFWMVLTSFSPGHLLLGSMIALVAGRAMAALHPERPRIRRWSVVPRLLWTLFMDVLRSNIAVTRLILTEGNGKRSSTFLVVPLTLRSQNALAVLSIIVTSTPGTAWIEYVSETGMLTVHIFDDKEAEHYRKVIKETYEPMLMEIFE